MRKASKISLAALMFALILGLIPYTVESYSENVITVKGTVYGERWDDKGEVTQVSILTVEGDELMVNDSAAANGLLKLVEQNLKVTGAVLIDQGGKKRMTVHSFEILQN